MTLSNNHCEIIIPVYNGLNHIIKCVESILKYTDYPYRIVFVDGKSNAFIKKRLREYVEKYSHVELIEKKDAKKRIKDYRGKYIVFLSPISVVTPKWLNKMIRCMESNIKIDIVVPVTNGVGCQSVPMPPGYSIFTISENIEKISKQLYPDIMTFSRLCLLIKKEAVEKISKLDKIDEIGCFKKLAGFTTMQEMGLNVVVADDIFVYSYAQNYDSSLENNKVLNKQRNAAHQGNYKVVLQKNPLDYLKELLTEGLEPVSKTKIALLKYVMIRVYRSYKYVGLENLLKRALLSHASKDLLLYVKNSFLKKKAHFPKTLDSNQDFFVTPKYISRLSTPRNLSVIYLVDSIGLYGGVISVVQLANELIMNGYDASIVTLDEEPEPGTFNLYTRPMRYKNLYEMAEYFPKADIVVATFWITAYYWMPLIIEKNPGVTPFYFIQGFESWFYQDKTTRQKVLDSYKIIPNKILKTLWLQQKLEKLKFSSYRIHLGLDLGIFYPRDTPKHERKRLLLIAQPYKRLKGFKEAIDVFCIIHRAFPEVEFVFFGCNDRDLTSLKIPFPYNNMGIISDQNQVASLYSSCDIFFDSSLFQGFGRPGIESMTCGIPPVLTNAGGVSEYARDNENCLLVPPANIDKAVEAIARLLEDKELYLYLKKNGLKTAKKFCHKDEAIRHIKLYEEIITDKIKKRCLRGN